MWAFTFKSAVRGIQRKKLFSLLNIGGIAVGLCLFLLALEFYRYETGFNLFHTEREHLYRLDVALPEGKTAYTYPAIAPLMEKRVPGVRKVIRFADQFNDGAIIAWQPPGDSSSLRSFREEGCVFVDPAFLDAFSFPLIAGSNQLDQTNTVVLAASAARQLFGNTAPVGQMIRLHNQFGDLPVKVVGVTADPSDQSDIRFRYLFSIHILENPGYTEGADWAKLTTWGNDSYSTFVWLSPKADPSSVAAAATGLRKQNDPDYAHKPGSFLLQPISDIHLGSGLHDDNPSASSRILTWSVLALGVLILVIAWINYINFATADALTRTRDIGIQKILGSQKRQIVARYVGESLIINAGGLLSALILAGVVQPLFNYITGRSLGVSYINNAASWGVILAVIFAGCCICGVYTGSLLSRLKPMSALHFDRPDLLGGTVLRKSLVVFQLVVCSIATALTLLAFKQIDFMRTENLGMDVRDLVVIKGPALKDSSFRSRSKLFRDELVQLPFVEKFSASGSVPGIGSGHNFGADGITGAAPKKDDDKIEYSISEVDENYFNTYHIPLISGSGFRAEDVASGFKNDRIMVNETAARLLGYSPADAAGKLVHWGKTFTITGVAKDYHHRSLREKIEPIIYIGAHNDSYYTIKTSSSGLSEKMERVRRIYSSLYPGNSFSFTSVRETFDRLYADDQRTATIALSLSITVILIASLGLAGLAAFTARRRTKEMGVRKVLGASTQRLFLLLSREYIILVTISLSISCPIAWVGGNQWLQQFPFRIQFGWPILLLAGGISLATTMLAISFHAARTAFVNPARQLRTE